MPAVTSKDGTRIVYDRLGSGPAVILVNGAMTHRGFWGHGPLAELLAGRFTVFTYDRRARGESGDAARDRGEPAALEREIQDLEALIDVAGGSASLYGDSSGAALVLEAALRLGSQVEKIALYEPPYNSDPAAVEAWRSYVRQLGDLLAADRRGDAIALFMKLTGAGDEGVAQMRQDPIWPTFEASAPSLAYDHIALLGEEAAVPVERAATLTEPALILHGSASYEFMGPTARQLAQAIPNAQLRTLEGQTHEVDPEVLAPVLIEFFSSPSTPGKGGSAWEK